MCPANTAQNVWLCPVGPLFDERLVAEVAMELVENDTLLRRRGRNLFSVHVGILPRPAELDEIFFPIGQQAKAEREAEARTGIENHARVRPGDLRLDGKTHARAVSRERREIEAKRFGLGFLSAESRGTYDKKYR